VPADPLLAAALDDWRDGRIADFFALKALCALAAWRGDSAEWLRLLAAFDPALGMVQADAPPRLGGIGPGALNSGRVLQIDGQPRYEKIYLAGSRCLRRMQHAHQAVLDPLRPVGFAPILRQRGGRRLVAVEFAFVPGLDDDRPRPGLALTTAARLGAIPMPADPPANTPADTPADTAATPHVERYPQHLDWAHERLLDRNRQRGHALARRLRLPAALRAPFAGLVDRLSPRTERLPAGLAQRLDRWSARLEAAPRVFSHGDLNCANLTDAGVVIDWDNAGWRAYGHDAAYATAFHTDARSLSALLVLSAEHVERPGTEAADRFAYLYFLLLLLPQAGAGRMDTVLARDLIAALDALETGR